MKRIYLYLAAAVVAFASCVEEQGLEPVGDAALSGNEVTIKAVAGDTKTVLNGTDVVWENGDAIKLVFKGENYYTADFITELPEHSAEATFTGILSSDVTVAAYGDKGFAVYPSSVEVESDGQIEFELLENQNGTVATGTNLSYAEVSLASLNSKGTAVTTFHNALSLLKITVPQGVKSVKVSSATPLVGNAPFYYDAEESLLTISDAKWYDSDRKYSVTLSNGEENLDYTKVHYVHVFPGIHENLTISIEGSEGSYTKTIDAKYEFVASNFYSLNIANIFSLSADEFSVSPLGGEFVIPVVTTLDDYEVEIPAEATWLTLTPQVKGAFRKDVLTFTASENLTSSMRSTKVTVKSGTKTLAEFTVSQHNYVADLLGEYLESYSKSGMPNSGTLKIELSDDFSKGVYKVTVCGSVLYANYNNGVLNMYEGKYTRTLNVEKDFSRFANSYLSIGGYTISDYVAVRPLGAPQLNDVELALVGTYTEEWKYNGTAVQGTSNAMTIAASDEAAFGNLKVKFLNVDGSYTECYANLSEDGKTLSLNCYGATHGKYYSIQQPIEMSVNQDGTLSFSSAYMQNWKEITAYVATKVSESEGGDDKEEEEESPYAYLFGTYSEGFDDSKYYGYPGAGTLTIKASDDSDYHLQMTFFGGTYGEVTVYAKVSDDGKSIITVAPTSGPALKPSTLSIEYLSMGAPIYGTVYFDYYEIYDYTASKVN